MKPYQDRKEYFKNYYKEHRGDRKRYYKRTKEEKRELRNEYAKNYYKKNAKKIKAKRILKYAQEKKTIRKYKIIKQHNSRIFYFT